MLGMTQFVNGQNVFSEAELDGVYKGLRQGAYYEQKAKEYEKTLRLFDSLTQGMELRLEMASQKEDNYLKIIEEGKEAFDKQKVLNGLEIETVKRRKNRWIMIASGAAFITGIIVAK